MNEFKKLNAFETRKLTMDELCEYKRKLRRYQAENNIKPKGTKVRKALHPLINLSMTLRRVFKSKLTLTTYINGQKASKLDVHKHLSSKNTDNRPIIFSVTHMGKFDIELVNEAIRKHYYLLSDDEEYMYRSIDGFFTWLEGAVYVDSDYSHQVDGDTKYSNDAYVAKETMITLGKMGVNLMYYPEAGWCFSENMMMYDCKFGMIEIAKDANFVIVPVAIDSNNKDFYVNIGDTIYPEQICKDVNSFEDKKEAMKIVVDKMSTLKYNIWDKHSHMNRDDISDDYWEKFVDSELAKWPYATREMFEKRIFKPKDKVSADEVFAPIKRIREKNSGKSSQR